jgi:hypothetical protein
MLFLSMEFLSFVKEKVKSPYMPDSIIREVKFIH